MAEGINRLIATQQAPNLLGAITGGVQARQSQQANQMNLQAAQQKQERQNRLLELYSQGASPQALQQGGFGAEALQAQQLQAGQQQIQAGQQEMLSEQEKRAVQYALALTEGATSMEDFQQKIMSAPDTALNQEYKKVALQLGPQGLQRLSGHLMGQKEVQSSEILPGGVVQVVYKDGTTEVKPASEAETELVRDAERRGAELQRQRAAGREGGKGTAKIALESFDRVGKIRENTNNLRQVVELVRGGAETGPLADRLPSFRAETIKLNTLKNQLGLDVVGAVTFGALSEGELKLALDTALPTNLDGPELVSWAEQKINAQEKLANNLERAAVFLSNPDNTVADWVALKRAEKVEKEQAQGGLPEGVSQELWDVMTPEERAAFQ